MTALALCVAASLLILLAASLLILRRARSPSGRPSRPRTFAFFHPRCSGGGGGERVLWKTVQILQRHRRHCVIYTVDPPDLDEAALRADAQRRFDVRVDQPVRLVSLHRHKNCLRPQPFLSLVMESVGTMKLAYRALQEFDRIDVFLDTTGCAFTFWVVRFWWLPGLGLGSSFRTPRQRTETHSDSRNLVSPWIVPYVHYPTISTDMMAQEASGHPERPRWKTVLKLCYYRVFTRLYGWVGQSADLVMVNSTWTYNHINALWNIHNQKPDPVRGPAESRPDPQQQQQQHRRQYDDPRIHIVYPPCRVPEPDPKLIDCKRNLSIVSIGQFRPEKEHKLQILALQRLLQRLDKVEPTHRQRQLRTELRLILIGSCRNDDDRQRVDDLKRLVKDLSLEHHVEFRVNPPYQELRACIETSMIGIHTMRQEHFGIGIVELMAAGLIVVAHGSGGPKADIVHPGITGFLAVTVDEYAEAMLDAFAMPETEQQAMRRHAQASAQRFSDEQFDASIERCLLPLLETE